MKSNKITTPRHYGFIASRTPDKGFLPCTISLTLGGQTGRCPVWARSGRGRTGARLLDSAPCAPEFCVGYWAGNSPGFLVSPELGPRVDTGQWGWAARGQATQLPTPTSPGPGPPSSLHSPNPGASPPSSPPPADCSLAPWGALGSPASSPSSPTRSCLPAHCCFLSDLQVLFHFSKQRQLYSERISSKIDSQQRENANQRRNASRLRAALHLGASGHSFPLGCGRHPERQVATAMSASRLHPECR